MIIGDNDGKFKILSYLWQNAEVISIENKLGISGFSAFHPEYGHGTLKRRTEVFFGIGSGV